MRFVVVLAALPLLACGGSKGNVEGKWQLSSETGEGGSVADFGQLKKLVTIDFTKDGKFDMSMVLPFKGDWTVDGNTVNMKVTEAAGIDMEKMRETDAKSGGKALSDPSQSMEWSGTLSNDGKTLTIASANKSGGNMVFQKAPN